MEWIVGILLECLPVSQEIYTIVGMHHLYMYIFICILYRCAQAQPCHLCMLHFVAGLGHLRPILCVCKYQYKCVHLIQQMVICLSFHLMT